MFDRFSEDARRSMSAARQAALEFGHDYIGTEHMLLGVLAPEDSVAATALRRMGIELARVRAEVAVIVRRGRSTATGQLPFTPRGKRALELALEEAQRAGHAHLATGHLLLGLVREGDGIAAQALGRLGVTLDTARTVVADVIRSETSARDGPLAPAPTISAALGDVFAEASAEAVRRGSPVVEPEDALVAMLDGDGIAARILRELGATPERVRRRARELRS